MDSFEMTKIAGAVLAALLLIFGTKTLVELSSGHKLEKPGYVLAGSPAPEAEEKAAAAPAADAKKAAAPDDGKAAAPADAKPAAPADAKKAAPADKKAAEAAPAAEGAVGADAVALLSKANAENGKAIFSKCKSCHSAEKGKPNGVGPNLYGVVNRPKGKAEGFKYSEAMLAKGTNWTFENLSAFLTNPKAYVAGTKMVFAGVPAAADRADLIAYLATMADTPVPLPK